MALRADQLTRALEEGRLPPIVLLASSEPLLLLEAADAVRTAAGKQGFSERQVFEVDAQFDWPSLDAAMAAGSLFASRPDRPP